MGKNSKKKAIEHVLSTHISPLGAFLVILFALSLSWLADAITYFCLGTCGSTTGNFLLGATAALFLAGLYLWWRNLSNVLPQPDITDITKISSKPVPVLILFLSRYNNKAFDTLDDKALYAQSGNWFMPCKAVEFHGKKLQNLHVLVSKDSAPQYDRFRHHIEEKYPHITLQMHLADIDDMERMKEIFHTVFDKYTGAVDRRIAIDITGGTKLYSIAASYFALTGHRVIQYVDGKDYAVRMFDNSVIPEES